jgi:predicted KAP-like P-loop ATPase
LTSLALEALRVFDPAVYRQIFGSKAFLTNSADSAKEQVGELARQITEGAANKPAAMAILMELFPRVATAWNRRSRPTDEPAWFRDRRVAHPDMFDRYFHLTLAEGDISSAELEAVVTAPNRAAIAAGLKAFADRELLDVALNRLDNYKLEIPRETAAPFITALFDLGERIPEGARFWGGLLSADAHARRIVYWILKREPSTGERGKLLREAVNASDGLFLPLSFLSPYTNEPGAKGESDDLDLRPEDLDFLRSVLLARIRQRAADGRLEHSPGIGFILARWREWGEPEEPRAWARKLAGTTRGALTLLDGLAGRSYSDKGLGYFFESV